jgi:predicted nucleic acid-binding protein
MIVVDTNIIGCLYLSSQRTEQAERAFLKDSEWVAPLLWRSEFRSVLAQYIRRGILRVEEAEQVMNEAQALMMGREYDVVSSEVLRLAARGGCTAYDCEFVALAQELGVVLVTVDREVLREFPGVAVGLEEYVGS